MTNTGINASAYVKDKKLYIMGLERSPKGAIPFSHVCDCQAEDGPVNFGDDLDPEIQAAIDNSQSKILDKIEREKIRFAAEELVDRTRAGDQNAAALMVMVKKNAEKGFPRAVISLEFMQQYASTTKVGSESNTGITHALAEQIASDDPVRSSTALNAFLPGMSFIQAVVTLSNGPELDKKKIVSLMSDFGNDEKEQFVRGFKNWNKKPNGVASRIGKAIGLARAIQLVRKPNTPISVLSKRAGMELD